MYNKAEIDIAAEREAKAISSAKHYRSDIPRIVNKTPIANASTLHRQWNRKYIHESRRINRNRANRQVNLQDLYYDKLFDSLLLKTLEILRG